ncbi:MAG: cell division protein ZapA [Oscillospiraceae bacterium]|nr:cell division protein ZapA [Oscillospiraceae bacterium]
MANKISLNIGGFNLIINTQEDEAQVRKLNDILNEDLKQILTQNPSASITNAALLCALDYLDRYDKATHSANNMRDQIKDYMADASNAKLQYDDQVRKNSDLAAEVENLRARITKLASEGAAGNAVEQSLRSELESVRNELQNTRVQFNEQVQRNSTILNDFGILNGALKNKDAEIAALNGRLEEIVSRFNEAGRRITDLQSELDATNAAKDQRINELQGELDTANASRDQLNGYLTEVTGRAEALERRLVELEEAVNSQPEPAYPEYEEEPFEPETQDFVPEETEPEAPQFEEYRFNDEQPAPSPFAFSLNDEPEEELTEDLEEDFTVPYTEPEEESLPIEEETPEEQPEPAEEEDHRDYRVFDYADGTVKEDDGEVGVDDNFKTFGQMIAEERRQPGNSYEDANSGKLDDDSLPNLSWINDID